MFWQDGTLVIHVDLVRNDIVAGTHTCIGRVSSLGELGVKIECDDSNIERALHEPLFDYVTGGHVTTLDHGDEYVALLSRTWQGSLVIVTDEHDEDDCPFSRDAVLSMTILREPRRH